MKSKWRQNRFEVSNISVIHHWGDLRPLPEIITVNLTNNAAWALGMVELPVMIKDELES